MPVFNEADTVSSYLLAIDDELRNRVGGGIVPTFFVTEDCSTDDTLVQLEALMSQISIKIVRNKSNRGHGPSTVRSIHEALNDGMEIIIVCDSDGQFSESDIGTIVKRLRAVTPGTAIRARRAARKEEKYRKLGTWAATLITSLLARTWSPDSNCPLRGFHRADLVTIMSRIADDHVVPAIGLTIATQKLAVSTELISVTWRPRMGCGRVGTMWTASSSVKSALRYLRFCLRATYYLFRTI